MSLFQNEVLAGVLRTVQALQKTEKPLTQCEIANTILDAESFLRCVSKVGGFASAQELRIEISKRGIALTQPHNEEDTSNWWDSLLFCLLQHASGNFKTNDMDELVQQLDLGDSISLKSEICKLVKHMVSDPCVESFQKRLSRIVHFVSEKLQMNFTVTWYQSYSLHPNPIFHDYNKSSERCIFPDNPTLSVVLYTDKIFKKLLESETPFKTFSLRKDTFECTTEYMDAVCVDLLSSTEFYEQCLKRFEGVPTEQISLEVERLLSQMEGSKTIQELNDCIYRHVSQNRNCFLQLLCGLEEEVSTECSEKISNKLKEHFAFEFEKALGTIQSKISEKYRSDLLRLRNDNLALESTLFSMEEEIKRLESERIKHKKSQDSLVADLQKKIENEKASLSWNKFKYKIQTAVPSYEVLLKRHAIGNLNNCKNLEDLVLKVQTILGLSNDQLEDRDYFVAFVKRNKFSDKRVSELISIVRNSLSRPQMQLTVSEKTLDICGRQIVLSEELQAIKDGRYMERIDKINFVAAESIFIDCDLNKSEWHGKNISIISDTIDVLKSITLDTSGCNAPQSLRKTAESGKKEGESGDHGEDGESGESGGNVYIYANHFINANYLTVIASGGDGADGQNGGDGKNGRQGRDGRDGTTSRPSRKSEINISYGTAGDPGGSGGKGGRGGLGGEGGEHGTVKISSSPSPSIRIIANDGQQGSDGKPGKGGVGGGGGGHGVDDAQAWIPTTWGKLAIGFLFGTGEWQHKRGSLSYTAIWARFHNTIFGYEIDVRRDENGYRRTKASNGECGRNGESADERFSRRKKRATKEPIDVNKVLNTFSSIKRLYSSTKLESTGRNEELLALQKQTQNAAHEINKSAETMNKVRKAADRTAQRRHDIIKEEQELQLDVQRLCEVKREIAEIFQNHAVLRRKQLNVCQQSAVRVVEHETASKYNTSRNKISLNRQDRSNQILPFTYISNTEWSDDVFRVVREIANRNNELSAAVEKSAQYILLLQNNEYVLETFKSILHKLLTAKNHDISEDRLVEYFTEYLPIDLELCARIDQSLPDIKTLHAALYECFKIPKNNLLLALSELRLRSHLSLNSCVKFMSCVQTYLLKEDDSVKLLATILYNTVQWHVEEAYLEKCTNSRSIAVDKNESELKQAMHTCIHKVTEMLPELQNLLRKDLLQTSLGAYNIFVKKLKTVHDEDQFWDVFLLSVIRLNHKFAKESVVLSVETFLMELEKFSDENAEEYSSEIAKINLLIGRSDTTLMKLTQVQERCEKILKRLTNKDKRYNVALEVSKCVENKYYKSFQKPRLADIFDRISLVVDEQSRRSMSNDVIICEGIIDSSMSTLPFSERIQLYSDIYFAINDENRRNRAARNIKKDVEDTVLRHIEKKTTLLSNKLSDYYKERNFKNFHHLFKEVVNILLDHKKVPGKIKRTLKNALSKKHDDEVDSATIRACCLLCKCITDLSIESLTGSELDDLNAEFSRLRNAGAKMPSPDIMQTLESWFSDCIVRSAQSSCQKLRPIALEYSNDLRKAKDSILAFCSSFISGSSNIAAPQKIIDEIELLLEKLGHGLTLKDEHVTAALDEVNTALHTRIDELSKDSNLTLKVVQEAVGNHMIKFLNISAKTTVEQLEKLILLVNKSPFDQKSSIDLAVCCLQLLKDESKEKKQVQNKVKALDYSAQEKEIVAVLEQLVFLVLHRWNTKVDATTRDTTDADSKISYQQSFQQFRYELENISDIPLPAAAVTAFNLLELFTFASECEQQSRVLLEYFREEAEKRSITFGNTFEILAKAMNFDVNVLLKLQKSCSVTSFTATCKYLSNMEQLIVNGMHKYSVTEFDLYRNQHCFQAIACIAQLMPSLPEDIKEKFSSLQSVQTGIRDDHGRCIFSMLKLFATDFSQGTVTSHKSSVASDWYIGFLLAFQMLFKCLPDNILDTNQLNDIANFVKMIFQLLKSSKASDTSEIMNNLTLIQKEVLVKFRRSFFRFAAFKSDVVQTAFDKQVLMARTCAEVLSSSTNENICFNVQQGVDLVFSFHERFRLLLEKGEIMPTTVKEKLLNCCKEKYRKYLKQSLNLSLDSSEIFEYITNLSKFPSAATSAKIAALVLMIVDLSSIDQDFFSHILFNSNNAEITWKKNEYEWENFIEYVRKILVENPQLSSSNISNVFKHLLADNSERSFQLNLLCLNPSEQFYFDFLESFRPWLDFRRIDANIIEIFSRNYCAQWQTMLKELLLKVLFAYLLQLYHLSEYDLVQPFVGNLCADKEESLKHFLCEFLWTENKSESSYTILTMHIEKISEGLQNIEDKFTVLKSNAKNIKNFWHLLKRAVLVTEEHHFGKEWLGWLSYLVRCLATATSARYNIVPFDDLKEILFESVHLPTDMLYDISESRFISNWVEVIYTQRFLTLVRQLITEDTSLIADQYSKVTKIGAFQKHIETWPTGRAKNVLLKLFCNRLVGEIQLTDKNTRMKISLLEELATKLSHKDLYLSDMLQLENKPLSQWKVVLRQQELLRTWPASTVIYALKLDRIIPSATVDNLLSRFYGVFQRKLSKELFEKHVNEMIKMIADKRWFIDETILKSLSHLETFEEWKKIFEKYTAEQYSMELSSEKLLSVMKDDPMCQPIASILSCSEEGKSILHDQLLSIKNKLKARTSLQDCTKNLIRDWTEKDVKDWATKVIDDKESGCKYLIENLAEVVSIFGQAIKLFTTKLVERKILREAYYPRDTQYLAVLIFINGMLERKGRLGEIGTGEGKTIITAMTAIYRALYGDDVDIITSSSVLAEENAKEMKPLYDMFNVSVGNNCDQYCEKDDDERRKRYKNQIVYGDVSSFQRDILLSKFFDNDITMNRVAGAVVIDEVDSMLLDKGENILYLSHNIPELRHLRYIFIEIWQAIHAPDVSWGSDTDVELVSKFIRQRMKEKEIVFPSYLNDLVENRLVTWVKNAYVAQFMNQNDPYIFGRVGKESERVIVMDKNTGVEQLQMQWSNGLHQFVQLKHMDKLSPESLKAVFMSNLSYFGQYPGKIYGITGTLGSSVECNLLTQCYKIDYFRLPRFKNRICAEEDGIVLISEETWLEALNEAVKKKNLHDSRAVLIICENVDSTDKISKRLVELTVSGVNVSVYKSSFDASFYEKNKTRPVEPTDVIVATNLAGRGMDLKTSTALEKAGGLHVILSYMPDNVRIEEQAFGRTARCGLSGSVQFIVKSSNSSEELTINTLRQRRDEKEYERLENVRTQSLQRILMEERLFGLFTETYAEIKQKLKDERNTGDSEKYAEYCEIQLDCLKNQWALWLDKMCDRIKMINLTGEGPILEAFSTARRDWLSQVRSTSKIKLAKSPTELVKLSYFLCLQGNFSDALACLEAVIRMEHHFSYVAHYYKAAVLLMQSSSLGSKTKAVYHFKVAEKLIQEQLQKLLTTNEALKYIDSLRQLEGHNSFRNQYEKQVKNEAMILQIYTTSIAEATGCELNADFLKRTKGVYGDDEAAKLFEFLRMTELVKNYRISKKVNFSENGKITKRDGHRDIEIDWLEKFEPIKDEAVKILKSGVKQRYRKISKKEFECIALTKLSFWKLLVENKIIQCEEKTSIIKVTEDTQKIEKVIFPEDLTVFASLIKKLLIDCRNMPCSQQTFTPLGLTDEQQHELEKSLLSQGVFIEEITSKGTLNTNVQWKDEQLTGLPDTLQKYKDLIKSFVCRKSQHDNGEIKIKIEYNVSMNDLPLPETASEGSNEIWSFLKQRSIIKDCAVNFSLRDKPDYTCKSKQWGEAVISSSQLKEIFASFHDSRKDDDFKKYVENILSCLKQGAGTVKTIPDIEVGFTKLENYFMTGEYPPEIQDYKEMMLGGVVNLNVKKSWKDYWSWEAFAVAMIGLAEIVGGVLLTVFTAGFLAHAGMVLISEGISDIIFAVEAGINQNFSWKSWGIHKAISLAISITTVGIGAYFKGSAQFTRFAGKTGTGLAKAASATVLKKCIQAASFGVANVVVAKSLDQLRHVMIEGFNGRIKEELISAFISANDTKNTSPAKQKINKKILELRKNMEQVYELSHDSSEAARVIQECLETVLEARGESYDRYVSMISCVVKSAATSIADNMKSCEHKYAKIAGYVLKLVQACNFVHEITQLLSIVSEILQVLNEKLKIEISNLKKRRSLTSKSETDTKEFVRFKSDFETAAKEKIVDLVLSKIQHAWVQPAAQAAAHQALMKFGKYATQKTKLMLKSLKRSENIKQLKEFQAISQAGHAQVNAVTGANEVKDTIDPDTPVENMNGKTVKYINEYYGNEVQYYHNEKGQLCAVPPSYEEHLNAMKNGNMANSIDLIAVANFLGRPIEIAGMPNEESSHVLLIKPIGEATGPPLRIAYKENPDGTGHFAATVNGEPIVIEQGQKSRNACLYQAIHFANHGMNRQPSDNNVHEFMQQVNDYARDSALLKTMYYERVSSAGAFEFVAGRQNDNSLEIDVGKVLFSQDSISGFVHTPDKSGNTIRITDAAVEMKEKGYTFDPIEVVKLENGSYVTMDNRRLAISIAAGIKCVPAKEHGINSEMYKKILNRIDRQDSRIKTSSNQTVVGFTKEQFTVITNDERVRRNFEAFRKQGINIATKEQWIAKYPHSKLPIPK